MLAVAESPYRCSRLESGCDDLSRSSDHVITSFTPVYLGAKSFRIRFQVAFFGFLPVAGVGQRPQDDAGVFTDGTPNIHGEGENNDEEEEIDAKQRMQQSAEGFGGNMWKCIQMKATMARTAKHRRR